MQKNTVKFILSIIFFFFLSFIMVLLVRPFFQPIAWAIVFSIAIYPLFEFLNRGIKSRVICAAVSIIILLALIILPSMFLITLLFNELKEAIAMFKNIDRIAYLKNVTDYIGNIKFIAPAKSFVEAQIQIYGINILDSVYGMAQNIMSFVTANSIEFIRNFIEFIMGLFILLMTTFFVLLDSNKIIKVVRAYLPFTHNDKDIFISKINDVVRATVFGVVIVAIAQGILGGIGFYFLKLPSPVLWGSVMALLSMIPFLGAPLVWFPAVIILVIKGAVLKAIILFLWGAFIVGLIDNLLRPVIVGMKTKLHPLLVFYSVFGGLLLLGPIGLFIGPIILSLIIVMAEIFKKEVLPAG